MLGSIQKLKNYVTKNSIDNDFSGFFLFCNSISPSLCGTHLPPTCCAYIDLLKAPTAHPPMSLSSHSHK